MTTFLVSRHPATIEYLKVHSPFAIDQVVSHLYAEDISEGDKVIGTLPINKVIEIIEKGASYCHFALDVTPEMRGKEISSQQLADMHKQLIAVDIKVLGSITL